MAFERELSVALDAARQAGSLILKAYESFIPIPNAPVTISTQADRDSQELILQHLCDAFPNDALCAEEATVTLQQSPRSASRIWVVDPIDGTRGFATKNGEFSVMIGLIAEGALAVGVVLEPAQGRVTFARRGGGCWKQMGSDKPENCRVSSTSELSEAVLVQSHPRAGTRSEGERLFQPHRIVDTYSAGVKLALVARGEVDLFLNTYSKFADWDICAGHLLVEEAGGVVTEVTGTAVQYGKPDFGQRGGLLASNGRLHEKALARLKDLAWS